MDFPFFALVLGINWKEKHDESVSVTTGTEKRDSDHHLCKAKNCRVASKICQYSTNADQCWFFRRNESQDCRFWPESRDHIVVVVVVVKWARHKDDKSGRSFNKVKQCANDLLWLFSNRSHKSFEIIQLKKSRMASDPQSNSIKWNEIPPWVRNTIAIRFDCLDCEMFFACACGFFSSIE